MVRPRKISLRERLAMNVRNERLARRWTQEDLEHRSGVSQRYISSVESAKSATSVDTIEKLADAFGIDGEWLLRRPSSAAKAD
jgi:transcriptional regulator with XRE-family HTH domain